MFTRLCHFVLAIISAFMLSSCLDYEEDLTIHKDLSGEAVVTITLPDSLMSKYDFVSKEFSEGKLMARFDAADGVKLTRYEYTEGRRPVVKLTVKFSSLEKLSAAAAANNPAGILVGQFTVNRDGDNVAIERKLGVGDPKVALGESNYTTFKTHFDGTIIKTNSGFHNSMGSDVRYRYQLADIVADKPVMLTEVGRQRPWALIIGGTVVAGVAAWYAWTVISKRKAKAA